MSHAHPAMAEFETSEEYQRSRATGGRQGLIDVDAIIARDAPEVERPSSVQARRMHGVTWYAQKSVWMVRCADTSAARVPDSARSVPTKRAGERLLG